MIRQPDIDLQALASRRTEPCVSMYLPTGAGSGEPLQGKIRLKNMLRKTEDRIKEMGVRNGGMLRDHIDRAYGFLDDSTFWMQGGRGLAVFIDPENFEYHLVPRDFKEVLVVSDRFHLKPLIPLISENIDFFILHASQKNPKLYRCNNFRIDEVAGLGLPADMADALMEEYPGDINMRSAHPPGFVGTGKIVHGHAGSMEGEKEKYSRYARIINDLIKPLLQREQLPLVLVGVRYEQDIYRSINTYPKLFETGVEGSAENWTLRELQEKAVEAIRPHYDREREEAIRRYPERKSAGLASNNLDEILTAAINGRVDSIFVGLGVQCWGTFDLRNSKAFRHEKEYAGDFDLLDMAATQTFMTGGAVYAMPPQEVPDSTGECPVSAAFRY